MKLFLKDIPWTNDYKMIQWHELFIARPVQDFDYLRNKINS